MYTLPAYVGIILKKNDHVLLIKRHNTDWASECWNFPGGLLEENETLTQNITAHVLQALDGLRNNVRYSEN